MVAKCISSLKQVVLNVLAEAEQSGECCLGIAEIKRRAGIYDYSKCKEAKKWTSPFTRALILELKYEQKVQRCEKRDCDKKGNWKGWQLAD